MKKNSFTKECGWKEKKEKIYQSIMKQANNYKHSWVRRNQALRRNKELDIRIASQKIIDILQNHNDICYMF